MRFGKFNTDDLKGVIRGVIPGGHANAYIKAAVDGDGREAVQSAQGLLSSDPDNGLQIILSNLRGVQPSVSQGIKAFLISTQVPLATNVLESAFASGGREAKDIISTLILQRKEPAFTALGLDLFDSLGSDVQNAVFDRSSIESLDVRYKKTTVPLSSNEQKLLISFLNKRPSESALLGKTLLSRVVTNPVQGMSDVIGGLSDEVKMAWSKDASMQQLSFDILERRKDLSTVTKCTLFSLALPLYPKYDVSIVKADVEACLGNLNGAKLLTPAARTYLGGMIPSVMSQDPETHALVKETLLAKDPLFLIEWLDGFCPAFTNLLNNNELTKEEILTAYCVYPVLLLSKDPKDLFEEVPTSKSTEDVREPTQADINFSEFLSTLVHHFRKGCLEDRQLISAVSSCTFDSDFEGTPFIEKLKTVFTPEEITEGIKDILEGRGNGFTSEFIWAFGELEARSHKEAIDGAISAIEYSQMVAYLELDSVKKGHIYDASKFSEEYLRSLAKQQNADLNRILSKALSETRMEIDQRNSKEVYDLQLQGFCEINKELSVTDRTLTLPYAMSPGPAALESLGFKILSIDREHNNLLVLAPDDFSRIGVTSRAINFYNDKDELLLWIADQARSQDDAPVDPYVVAFPHMSFLKPVLEWNNSNCIGKNLVEELKPATFDEIEDGGCCFIQSNTGEVEIVKVLRFRTQDVTYIHIPVRDQKKGSFTPQELLDEGMTVLKHSNQAYIQYLYGLVDKAKKDFDTYTYLSPEKGDEKFEIDPSIPFGKQTAPGELDFREWNSFLQGLKIFMKYDWGKDSVDRMYAAIAGKDHRF